MFVATIVEPLAIVDTNHHILPATSIAIADGPLADTSEVSMLSMSTLTTPRRMLLTFRCDRDIVESMLVSKLSKVHLLPDTNIVDIHYFSVTRGQPCARRHDVPSHCIVVVVVVVVVVVAGPIRWILPIATPIRIENMQAAPMDDCCDDEVVAVVAVVVEMNVIDVVVVVIVEN